MFFEPEKKSSINSTGISFCTSGIDDIPLVRNSYQKRPKMNGKDCIAFLSVSRLRVENKASIFFFMTSRSTSTAKNL